MADSRPILLAGSTGFIGGRLLYALDSGDFTVRGLVRKGESLKTSRPLRRDPDVDIYGPTQPDVILMDVMMPFLDGDKKIELLRKREASRNIPVILISAKPEGELETIARNSGADGFLTKPLAKSDLVAMIRRNS